MTWDDELRTIKIAILSVALRQQLEVFQRLFEAFFLFSKPMKLRSLLKIYLFYLVIEADTETDKVAPNFSSCCGSFCTFYLYGALLQWLAS